MKEDDRYDFKYFDNGKAIVTIDVTDMVELVIPSTKEHDDENYKSSEQKAECASAISDLKKAIEKKDNSLLYSSFKRIQRYSEFFWEAAFEMGKLYFEGKYICGDLSIALDYLIMAKKMGGNSDVSAYLHYYLGPEPDDVQMDEKTDNAERPLRAFGASSIHRYEFPDDYIDTFWEWELLNFVSDTDIYTSYCFGEGANEYHGFSNKTFFMRPYMYDESDENSVIPNFRFNPTGFEIDYYKHFFRDGYMNQNLSPLQIRIVWVKCIDSILLDNREKFKTSDFGIMEAD